MAKAIFNPNGFARGISVLPKHGDRTATVREAVHDGDTITVEADGGFSIRFLGVDTAEVSFKFPKIPGDPRSDTFRTITEFQEYLSDPFNAAYPDSQKYANQLGNKLVNYLKPKLNSQTALNHHKYAIAAQRELESIIEFDVNERIYEGERFKFFMAFAHEVMDRYGRFLCYVDRNEDKPREREGRLTYNERMLKSGLAIPYFIWPNINPFFRKEGSLVEAVPAPEKFKEFVNNDKRIKIARNFVNDARRAGIGIFDKQDPLALMPFELRYLAGRRNPDRYVLDMSKDIPKLLKPTDYYLISKEEDRLFVEKHFVPLFENKGYQAEDK
jgi:endonuclease YncB( thermonuclease family)